MDASLESTGPKGKDKGDDIVRVPVMGATGLSPQHGVVTWR